MSKETKDNTKTRFSSAPWFGAGSLEIIIGGVGGIGSWVALFLGRIGHQLYLFDDDTVDTTNLAGQFYRLAQTGSAKTTAVADNVQEFAGIWPEEMGRFTEDSAACPIMFSCFDSMSARKLMFEKWAAQEDRQVFIDGRMLAETGMVFVVQKGQEDMYRSELFDDGEVEDADCSYKATSHCGAFIASLMVAGLNNYLTNVIAEDDIRVVQFRTDFELPLLTVSEMVIVEEHAS